jgi:signal transduction histidine kinase
MQIFTTASDITVQHRNGGTIKIAVDKASKVIFALKSYAHFDNEDNFSEVNIIEGIENIITLHTNIVKQGIELIKYYDKIPDLKCLPDQLGQVWTNLIANSIHAMNGKGVLTISLMDKPSSVLINFEDSGKGIPKDVGAHIFKPFFTTKSSGEGSGLGLHLVKKIIDKHGGEISFVSDPGKTIFTIEIPKKEYINDRIIAKANELYKLEQSKEAEMKEKLKTMRN